MAQAFTSKTFKFELISPERVVASEEVSMVIVPGKCGDFGVLADHAPMLSSVRPGVVEMHGVGGNVRKIFISGGFADVNGKTCSVLAQEAVSLNDLDAVQVEQQLKSLQSDLANAGEDYARALKLRQGIEIAQAKLAALAA